MGLNVIHKDESEPALSNTWGLNMKRHEAIEWALSNPCHALLMTLLTTLLFYNEFADPLVAQHDKSGASCRESSPQTVLEQVPQGVVPAISTSAAQVRNNSVFVPQARRPVNAGPRPLVLVHLAQSMGC